MSGHNGTKLSQRLHACVQDIWPRYLSHPFVTQMADGTLPMEKFRYYMLQDYLYLKYYVKIFAAIIQKADDFEQIRFLSGELANTIGETFRTHLPYMQRLGVTEDEIRRARPHIDNSAYSHYMLCEAQAGDVLTGLALKLLMELCLHRAGDGGALSGRASKRTLRRVVRGLRFGGVPPDESGAHRPDRRARRGHRRADNTASVRDLPNVLPV